MSAAHFFWKSTSCWSLSYFRCHSIPATMILFAYWYSSHSSPLPWSRWCNVFIPVNWLVCTYKRAFIEKLELEYRLNRLSMLFYYLQENFVNNAQSLSLVNFNMYNRFACFNRFVQGVYEYFLSIQYYDAYGEYSKQQRDAEFFSSSDFPYSERSMFSNTSTTGVRLVYISKFSIPGLNRFDIDFVNVKPGVNLLLKSLIAHIVCFQFLRILDQQWTIQSM